MLGYIALAPIHRTTAAFFNGIGRERSSQLTRMDELASLAGAFWRLRIVARIAVELRCLLDDPATGDRLQVRF